MFYAGLCLGVSVVATLTTACVAIAFGVGMLTGGLFMRFISRSSACHFSRESREREGEGDGEEVELAGPLDNDGDGPVMTQEGSVTTPTHNQGGRAAVPAVYEEILALQSVHGPADGNAIPLNRNEAYENPTVLSQNPAYEKPQLHHPITHKECISTDV